MSPQIKVRCPYDGEVVVRTSDVILDDEDGTYRFRCSAGNHSVEKPCDDGIRKLLRHCGVASIDEVVQVFAGVLADDSAIWRGLLTT